MKSIRALVSGMFLAVGVLAFSPTPSFACHQATGLCCVEDDDGYFCCMFVDNRITGCGRVRVQ